MKTRFWLTLYLATLFLTPVVADVVCTVNSASGFTGGTITSPILAPAANNCAAVPYSFTGDANTGLCTPAADTLSLYIAGAPRAYLGSTAFQISSAFGLGFTSGNAEGTLDTAFYRESAAVFQLGSDAATATAYEVKCADSTGANVAGANCTISAGDATNGNANGGNLILAGGALVGTGQSGYIVTNGNRQIGNAPGGTTGGVEAGTFVTLTEGAATSVATVNVPSAGRSGGTFEYCVFANDAAEFQARCATIKFAVINPSGTETCVMSPAAPDQTNDGNAGALSSGTLTYAVTCSTTPTNGVALQINASSSLAQTLLRAYGVVRTTAPVSVIF